MEFKSKKVDVLVENLGSIPTEKSKLADAPSVLFSVPIDAYQRLPVNSKSKKKTINIEALSATSNSIGQGPVVSDSPARFYAEETKYHQFKSIPLIAGVQFLIFAADRKGNQFRAEFILDEKEARDLG